MLTTYIRAALGRARYERLPDHGSFYILIKGISAESFLGEYGVKLTSIEMSGNNCEGRHA